ncbi:MAG TPA: AI-2E family transporter [Burkholderiales bacterium]|nr:AI-2E family transporter [Burkholderiales bacterium]
MAASPFANRVAWAWAAIAAAVLLLLYVLSPILAPFMLAAILAYILDPLVERLSGRYLPRTGAVVIVLLLLVALLAAFALVVAPLFAKEARLLAERAPGFLTWANTTLSPWLQQRFGVEFQLDVDSLRRLAADAISGDVAARLLGSLKIGGLAVIAFFANLLLVPVVLFYLLRDWHPLIERADRLIPRALHQRARTILAETDRVLAEFLRGQVLVILVMSVYYVTALWLARLEFALPVGVITGVLVFIPYVGAITGLALGTVAAVIQFSSLGDMVWVWVAFGVGQALEGTVVTPLLVGERVGLHPVAVIFALLAFGQVFGFFGVLVALPASAALLVGLRHLRAAYVASPLYDSGK